MADLGKTYFVVPAFKRSGATVCDVYGSEIAPTDLGTKGQQFNGYANHGLFVINYACVSLDDRASIAALGSTDDLGGVVAVLTQDTLRLVCILGVVIRLIDPLNSAQAVLLKGS
jgi:hypothetical protein